MIKDTEIRKGNKLSFYKPLIHEPQQLTVKGYYYNEDDGLWYVQSDEYADINTAGLMGIPLTPEWLDKFSFRQFANGAYHKDAMLTWRIWYDDFEKAANYCTDVYPELGHAVYLPIRIEFVHELQNIYFIMTGEELTIKT